jgi:glycolate oxidase
MKVRREDGRSVPLPEAEWRGKFERVREEIIADGVARGGVISGEHGIGLVKKRHFAATVPAAQLELMRALRRAFDPNGILNPGKIFDG